MSVYDWIVSLRLIRWRTFWFRTKLWIAAKAFRSQRADYYEYLADLIEATLGTKTLQTIFQDDAARHASSRARSFLSRVWLDRFPQTGGDLFATWHGSLPTEDLLAIRSAQYAGAHALTRTLRQLAEVVRLIDRTVSLLVTTAFVGVAGLLMALGSILSIPFFTVKQLRQAFASVPTEYYSSWTQALFATADWLSTAWPFVAFLMVCFAVVFSGSFANWNGPLRVFADQFGPWAFYRRVQTVRFIALLAVTLSPGRHQSSRLREAIFLQVHGASPWFLKHLYAMVTRLDLGSHAIEAMDTGLIDSEIWWYFTDLIQTLGLDEALIRTRIRTEAHAMRRIHSQALFLRWCLLLLALSIVLGIAFWHVQVFEELRQALSLHYSR